MSGPFGEIVQQGVFYALLERANVLQPPLIALCADQAPQLRAALSGHPVLGCLGNGSESAPEIASINAMDPDSLELCSGDKLRGHVHRDNRAEGREDDNLSAHLMLEALCAKASGAIALQTLLHRSGLEASSIDYVISCGEEAAGDRYQRGGGLAKAIGEMCSCTNASGMDVKNFCAAPASALITAGALVKAGVYERIVVVADGSLNETGFDHQRHRTPNSGSRSGTTMCFSTTPTRCALIHISCSHTTSATHNARREALPVIQISAAPPRRDCNECRQIHAQASGSGGQFGNL